MDATAQSVGVEQGADGALRDEPSTSGQAGSVSFPELVRAHYEWERSSALNGDGDDRYHELLARFQEAEGDLVHAYWATRRPSAVALTIKRNGWLRQMVTDHDCAIRLHRATDWLARESSIAELMHHCDTLAIKVSEVLRGSAERIAMQWIYAVQSHLLGFIERTGGRANKKEIEDFVEHQKDELIEIERYYARAATKAARIVYFWGMVIGVLASGVIGLGLAGVVRAAGWFDDPNIQDAQTFFVCYVSGTIGAFISVLMRMSSNSFRVDYEVGRSTIRRLGSFRPFIGAVFGVALYFIVLSGILNIQLPDTEIKAFFFLGTLAFLAGFNERWTNVIFGKAEQTIAVSLESDSDRRRSRREEDDEDDPV
ncbi:MAG TPA: hypothetical protein VFO03_09155 [Gaiellaceae bacterium]|nr:hypothetical protein [Gaiellaceae bacterium]